MKYPHRPGLGLVPVPCTASVGGVCTPGLHLSCIGACTYLSQ